MTLLLAAILTGVVTDTAGTPSLKGFLVVPRLDTNCEAVLTHRSSGGIPIHIPLAGCPSWAAPCPATLTLFREKKSATPAICL